MKDETICKNCRYYRSRMRKEAIRDFFFRYRFEPEYGLQFVSVDFPEDSWKIIRECHDDRCPYALEHLMKEQDQC